MREFFGEWNAGPFHCYPFRLQNAGDSTLLHAHKHDHLTRSSGRTALYALLPDKQEKIEILNSAMEWRLVRANITHMLIALEADVICECLFSRYDQNGCFVENPKELARVPYTEPTSVEDLPESIKEVLAKEGVIRG